MKTLPWFVPADHVHCSIEKDLTSERCIFSGRLFGTVQLQTVLFKDTATQCNDFICFLGGNYVLNPHRASDCIYHLQVFLKSFPGFRNFRASHIQWVWLWVLEWEANYFSCIGKIYWCISRHINFVHSLLQSSTNREIFVLWIHYYNRMMSFSVSPNLLYNRVCGTRCTVINLSAEYFGLSKNSVTHFGRGLFALLHRVCSHLNEGTSFLGTTRYISICYCTLKPLYIVQ